MIYANFLAGFTCKKRRKNLCTELLHFNTCVFLQSSSLPNNPPDLKYHINIMFTKKEVFIYDNNLSELSIAGREHDIQIF